MPTKSHPGNKVSLIFYENTTFPRYYDIQKNLFKFALYGLPTIALLGLIGALLMGLYIKREQLLLQRQVEGRLSQERGQELLRENRDLQKLTSELQTRLASPVGSAAKILPRSLFLPPKGQKDLSGNPRITIEKIDALATKSATVIKFNLVNQATDNTRMAGFLHIILKADDRLIFWPKGVLPQSGPHVSFNSGESFSAMRFRPVVAQFPPLPVGSSISFWVVSHSLTGDFQFARTIEQILHAAN